ncbi:hypothetical protein B0T20DRAFT_477614 [Sordaria brevicollis]|uniref:Uncharacterized protein n=1 Tax=Sordaria brevicollis TaxID=83679 RepID=A0AAE0UDH1_SORBR|nr:hypothetical protein B0T20DRAFT_477614 [Sordaria brevicollis]
MAATRSNQDIAKLMEAVRPNIVISLDIGTNSFRVLLLDGISKNFSSHAYPFDDKGPVYKGEQFGYYASESVSLKYGFYILANAADKFVDQYPMLQKLIQADSPAFRQKLRVGTLQLLKEVHAWIFQGSRKDWVIDKLVINIPVQWGSEFQAVALDLIGEAFKWDQSLARKTIAFHKDADSLMQYLMTTPRYLNPVKVAGADQVWLVMDYGGHNLSASLWWVRHNKQVPPMFFRLEKPFSAGGGTEHVLHYILEACAVKCLNQNPGQGRPMCPGISEQVREGFSDPRVRGMWGPALEGAKDNCFAFMTPLWEEQNCITCTFDQGEITPIWDKAHKHAFELVDNLLKNLRKRTAETDHPKIDPKPVIFIAGGSTKNKPVKHKLAAMVKEANLPDPIFLD